ncbi:hypothetical protein [Legionella cardiaca]|uniref:Protein-glutamine glutaminase n=1 Tax=Legionella cardiaca TaxID=1071983 RepID=A0ABY8ARQ4_9GAMM|nr:hypothetical protein [Legionella cardiaca]WED43139.1 hypothetical protein PXX05_14765 [Legionella cardiaca]
MRQRHEIIVEMDEQGFAKHPDEVLITEGICTCIAFVVQGVFNKGSSKIPCFGLYHWSGFPVGFQDDPVKYTDKELATFLSNLRTLLKIDEDKIIDIKRLEFIGGELSQYGDEGELILSGTQKEVDALKKASYQFDYVKAGFAIKKESIVHNHFLTSEDQSLKITVSQNKIEIDYQGYEEEIDNSHSSSFFL